MGYTPWGHTGSDMPEVTEHAHSLVLRERPIHHEVGIKPGTLTAASSNGVLSPHSIRTEFELRVLSSAQLYDFGLLTSCSWTIVS